MAEIELCETCETPRLGAGVFCTMCGSRLAPASATPDAGTPDVPAAAVATAVESPPIPSGPPAAPSVASVATARVVPSGPPAAPSVASVATARVVPSGPPAAPSVASVATRTLTAIAEALPGEAAAAQRPAVQSREAISWPSYAAVTRRHRRRPGRALLAVLLALALGAGGFALTSLRPKAGSAYALRFSPGETQRYRMRMTMDAMVGAPEVGLSQPLRMTTGVVMAMRVASVDPDGVATVDVLTRRGWVRGQGRRERIPRSSTSLRIAPDGRILSAAGFGAFGGSSGNAALSGLDQFMPILPPEEVAPGDTWDSRFEFESPFGPLEYTSENTLVGYRAVGERRAAVIRSDLALPLDVEIDLARVAEMVGGAMPGVRRDAAIAMRGRMQTDQTTLVDLAAGRLLRSRSTTGMHLVMDFGDLVESSAAGRVPSEIRLDGRLRLTLRRLA